jgi:hypothetical protein
MRLKGSLEMQIQRVFLNLKAVSTGAFDPAAPLLRFVAAALVAPFILLTIGGRQSNNLPWYFWATILLMLLAVVCVGYLRFTRDPHEAEDISIRPGRR